MTRRRWGTLLAAVVLLAASQGLAAPPVRRALVIAHNASDDPALPPLRYADDDGVLWTELLRRLGVETTLLVEPDAETRQTGAAVLASGVRPPTPEEVSRAVESLRGAIQADHATGRRTDVLLVYVGHGNTDEVGRAYFTVKGGRLDRTAFYAQLVDPLGADFVHVIVDACRASGVVGSRGQADAAVLAELRGTLEREQLAARPHVGALFAESDTGETHEWSRLRAGVFSHVVRSGLMGGADVNGDGAVEYSELAGFVAASLQGVKALPARLSVRAQAPARDPRRPLVGPSPEGPSLLLPAEFEHARISVEDEEGRRLADVRRAEGQPLALRLPVREAYWVRTPTAEARIALAQLGAGVPRLRPRELQERGPVEDALRRGLFSVAFDRSFYERYVSTSSFVPVDFVPGRVVPLDVPLAAFVPEPPSPWEVGAVVARTPLGLGGFTTGPSVALRTSAPYTLGVRVSYALSLLSLADVTLHRLSVQGLAGFQGPGRVGPFVEAAAGWSLIGVKFRGGLQGDPTVLSGHLSGGVVARMDSWRLRAAGFIGTDRITADGEEAWGATWGVELSLGH
ncbi:caspase family protein [Archangium violaceum]|uniref:caspase family protein n=1 Tax=Archangium violaceum TaxID=83451 RepID=UPI00194F2BE7|nr:caspase family protein [Archangium violaceum]QRN95195.1 caspase family protein [Archangium violaceum]